MLYNTVTVLLEYINHSLQLSVYNMLDSAINCDPILENRPLQVVTFSISRNTDFKYSSHCSSLVLDCSHARYTV